MTTKCPYTKQFIEARKEDLLSRKLQITEQLKSISHKDSDHEGDFDANFPEYGEKEDDNATEVADYAGNLSMEETLKTTLEMIEKALIKIDNGTYGICIECMDEPKNLCPTCPLIPKPRLLAVPHTQHCVEIKNAAAANNNTNNR